MLLYFLSGGKFLHRLNSEQLKKQKLDFVIESMTDMVPIELVHFYNYVKGLNQNDMPEYHVILSIFENFFYENIEEG
jgi:hypothetical protein